MASFTVYDIETRVSKVFSGKSLTPEDAVMLAWYDYNNVAVSEQVTAYILSKIIVTDIISLNGKAYYYDKFLCIIT